MVNNLPDAAQTIKNGGLPPGSAFPHEPLFNAFTLYAGLAKPVNNNTIPPSFSAWEQSFEKYNRIKREKTTIKQEFLTVFITDYLNI